MSKKNVLTQCYIVLPIALIFISCGQIQNSQQSQGYSFSGDTVYVEKDSPLFANLSIVMATEASFSKKIEAPAKIAADPAQLAYVTLPFVGRAVRLNVRLGQKIRAGTPLFELISSDFIAAQKEFFQAQSARDLALKDLHRKEELHKNGVAAQRELEEADNTFKIADKEYENAAAVLKIFHSNPAEMVVGQPLVVCSPIEGEVIESNLVAGQYFKDDENHAMIVANLQKVWVKAHINEKDVRFVHLGDELSVRVEAQPDKLFSGKVFHISDIVDEETLTITVIAECDNYERLLKAGMFASVVITAVPQNRIVVPINAIMQEETYSYVFVKIGETSFVKRQVTVESVSEGKAILSWGVENGTEIIGAGAYQLRTKN